jgi:tetratricopeptide (TPR) repeat protein
MNKVLALTLAFITFALLFRPATGRLYEHQGAVALKASAKSEGANQEDFACLQPPFVSHIARNDLQIAINKLERAADFWDTAHVHLLLGRAYCYAGQLEMAIETYSTYTQLRPNNLLARLEIAAAYSAACNPEIAIEVFSQFCLDNTMAEQVQHTWEYNNHEPERFIHVAHSAFEGKKYSESARYFLYHSSYSFREKSLSDSDRFQWAVSAALTGNSLPHSAAAALPVFQINKTTRVNGEELRWMRQIPDWNIEYGDHPQVITIHNQKAAVVAWNGSVVAVIEILESGNYEITVQVFDALPSPILALVEVNERAVGEVELTAGDSSWKEKTYPVYLEQGHQLVGIRFTNNDLVDNIDRNLLIGWIEITYLGE